MQQDFPASDLIDYDFGITAIDSHYERPIFDAVHLVVEDGRCAIIDCGHNEAVPRILAGLAARGMAPESVDYLVLTHIHLDHAGGAGLLMKHLPVARLVVHPRGARHMRDPAKLVEGAVGVYGAEAVQRLYGEILPIAAERILEAPDGFSVSLGKRGRALHFIDTPGHARHHMCIRDTLSGHLFTGDTFGLSYRELDVDGRPSIFPTTTPIQFDPQALHQSVDAILAWRPDALYLTHYSQVRDVERLGADLHRLIDAHVAIARAELNSRADAGRHERLKNGVLQLVRDEARLQGWTLPESQYMALLGMDIELNAAGLGSWLDSRPPA